MTERAKKRHETTQDKKARFVCSGLGWSLNDNFSQSI